MRGEVERLLGAELARLRVAWGASVLGVLLFAALGAGLAGADPFGAGRPARPWAALVAGLGLAVPAAVIALDRRLHAPGRVAARARHPLPEHVLRHLAASHLVLWSLSEVPAILGLVQLVLGGSLRTLLLLCAATLGVLAWLAPTRGRLTASLEDALR